MIELPRLVVAGTRSGVGKTTIATGLMAAFAARGARVSGHKVGPDFIDPGYHALATGRPPRNLDTVMHGPQRIGPLLAHGATGADLAIIEGVMGFFDGRGSGDAGSTAEVARRLAAPVVLTVDAAASSRSLAAEVHGFATFDPSVRIAGVVLNNLGSDGHEQLARAAVAETGIEVLGALHRDDRLVAPSRHLGLVPAMERSAAARESVALLAEAVAAAVDLDAVERLARAAPPLAATPWDPAAEVVGPAPPRRPRIAVAGGPAFGFTYTEHPELLAAAGAEVVPVDPLRDEALPDRIDALLLGGGFPEVFAEELGANGPFVADVQGLARRGRPIVAECGGLLYLVQDLDGRPMAGVLDARARFTDRLTMGYREAVTVVDSVLGPAGTRATGHEFHRTEVVPTTGDRPAWRFEDRSSVDGFVEGAIHASYLHASWVGSPGLARALVAASAMDLETP